MNEARTEILARVKNALGRERGEPSVLRAYRRDVELGPDELLRCLADRLREYKAVVYECAAEDLPAQLRRVLAEAHRVVIPIGLPPAWAPEGATVDDDALSPHELDTHDTVLTACAAACA